METCDQAKRTLWTQAWLVPVQAPASLLRVVSSAPYPALVLPERRQSGRNVSKTLCSREPALPPHRSTLKKRGTGKARARPPSSFCTCTQALRARLRVVSGCALGSRWSLLCTLLPSFPHCVRLKAPQYWHPGLQLLGSIQDLVHRLAQPSSLSSTTPRCQTDVITALPSISEK